MEGPYIEILFFFVANGIRHRELAQRNICDLGPDASVIGTGELPPICTSNDD